MVQILLASKIFPVLESYVIHMILGSMYKKDGQLNTDTILYHVEMRFEFKLSNLCEQFDCSDNTLCN